MLKRVRGGEKRIYVTLSTIRLKIKKLTADKGEVSKRDIFQEALEDVGDVGQSKTESGRACGAEGTEEERCQVHRQAWEHRESVTSRLDQPSVPAKECSPFILPLPGGKQVRG